MGKQNCISDKTMGRTKRPSCPNLSRAGRTACQDVANLSPRARFPLSGGPQPSVTCFSGENRGAHKREFGVGTL